MAQQEWVYGIHAVAALLKKQHQIDKICVLSGRRDARLQQLLDEADAQRIFIESLDRDALDKLTDGNHQGVAAKLFAPIRNWNENDLEQLLEKASKPLLLILDGITDPHNLGACLRSADAAGVTAVIAPKDNAASITPVVRKVACGAAEVVPFVQVTNLARTMKWLQEQGVWLVGTAGEAEQSLYQIDLTGAIGIVMGAEGKGMRRLTRENCDYLANLPMAGSVSSLNISVATGICLFEVVRQRLPK
jgi:23S rRNA (guanosine2251-2'-O)-methyltransferase